MGGYPAYTPVPMSWSQENLTIGVQFAGRDGDEATLIRIASQIEAARQWAARKPEVSS